MLDDRRLLMLVTSRAQRAGPDLSGQRCCKLRLKLLAKKKAVRRVRHCKEAGLQEWPLAGRATVPRVLYRIGLRMSLCRRTILCDGRLLASPFTLFAGRHLHGRQNRRSSFCSERFGKRLEFGDNREVWKAFVCRYAPPRSCCSWGTAEAKHCMPAPRRLRWMASDVIDAEFRRCQCVDLSSIEPFLAFAPVSSQKTLLLISSVLKTMAIHSTASSELQASSEIVKEYSSLLREGATLSAWRWIFKL